MNDSPPQTANERPYRPVSPWAVAGLGVAGLYTLGLLLFVGFAWRSGQPPLTSPATLLIPLAAAIFSLAGWFQVGRSEGQRVGRGLAQVGLVLSAGAGLSYAAYWYSTEQALRLQGRDFTTGWLERVSRGGNDLDADIAFWDTLDARTRDRPADLGDPEVQQALARDPAQYQAVRAALRDRYFWGENGARGPLPLFFDHELVARVRQGGKQTSIEPLGVRSWQYVSGTGGGYRLEQDYRISTPEGVFSVVLPVYGVDQERRQRRLLLSGVEIRQAKLSAFGGRMRDLRLDSRRFAAEWASALPEGAVEVRTKELVAPSAEVRAAVLRDVPGRFAQGKGLRLQVASSNVMPATPWQWGSEELLFFQPFELHTDKYRCTGAVVVATRDRELLAKLRELEAAGAQSAELPRLPQQKSWRIVRVELESGAWVTQERE